MDGLVTLWLPILLSTVAVFVASVAVWMILPHHRNDWTPPADEDALREGVAKGTDGPGLYYFPFMQWGDRSDEAMADFRERWESGPAGVLRVRDFTTTAKMAPAMFKSFILFLVVTVFVAYIASAALAPGASYLAVFQITGTAAFMAHGFIGYQESIWFGLPFSVAVKHSFDGLLYALLTAGVFGWLWPA